MAFTFKPAVYDGASLYLLPRPVTSIRIQDGWDFEQFKVPLADGDALVGHSRDGVDILVEGQIGSQAGGLKATEGEMFDEIGMLRDRLDVTSGGDEYEFFVYHDALSKVYRKFKRCSTIRFESDLSNKSLFTFSIVLHAEDPTIYSTGPGL